MMLKVKTALALSVLLGLAGAGRGAEFKASGPGRGIAYGNLLLTPQLWLNGGYESNIYWSSTDEESDYLATLSPGISLRLPWQRNRNLLELSYRADLAYYRDHPQENHQDHTVDGYFRYRLSDYAFEAGDTYRKTSSRFDTEFRERIPRTDNTGWARISADHNSFSFEAGYRNFYRRFDSSLYDRYGRDENAGIFSVLYRVAPKTQALVEYVYNDINYLSADERDGHYQEILGGFRGDLTSRLTGTAKIGYQNRRYDEPYWNDFDGLVGYVSLEQYFSRNTDLKLGWERSLQESTYASNSYYQINRVWARFSQQLAAKTRGFLEAGYGNYRYPNPDGVPGGRRRTDDAYTAVLGVTYSLQEWLEFTLRYSWRRRESNVPDLDYTDHIFGLTAYAFY